MKLNIRIKLLIGFILVVILAYLIQAFTVNIARTYISSQVDNIHNEKAKIASDEIKKFFAVLISYSSGLATEYKKDITNNTKQISTISKYVIENNEFINKIAFLTPSGRETIKIDRFGQIPVDKLSFEIASDQFLTAVLGKASVSKVYYLDEETGPHVDLFSPIFSDKETVIGIIKMQIKLTKLWDIISKVKLGNNGFAYIVDEEGRLIAHPNQSFVLSRPILTDRKFIAAMITQDAHTLSSEEDYRYVNEKGVRVIAKGAKVPVINWHIIFEQPEFEAFAFLNFIWTLFIFTFFITLALLFLIAFSLSNNLTRPIQKLKDTAKQLEQGKLETRIALHSGDELEELGNALNTMAKNLQTSFHKIEEHRIKSDKAASLLLRRDLDLREINDQLEAEKEIISAEKNKLSLVLSGITDAVIAVDVNSNVILFNSASEKLTGFTASEAIGKPISQLIRVYDKNDELPTLKYCPVKTDGFEGIVYKKRDLKIEGRDKKQSFINLIAGQIKEGKRVELGCILSMHDVTEEKKLEEMKIDFVSMAAHELRTPLTAIRGYADVLKDKIGQFSQPDIKMLIDRLVVSSENLGSLIDNLLNVSRIEQSTFKVELGAIDLSQTISEIVNSFQQQAQTKKQTLSFHTDEKLPPVLADVFRINQVVSNLLANATSYTPEGGNIKVSIRKKNDKFLEVEISDTGIGIPHEALSKLFTKFFRVSGMLEEGSKGTGLGLYIAKMIVNMHHGEISAESIVGKGSTFRFTLPIATASDIEKYHKTKPGTLTGKGTKGIIVNEEAYEQRFGRPLKK